jgi:hypothetical protein
MPTLLAQISRAASLGIAAVLVASATAGCSVPTATSTVTATIVAPASTTPTATHSLAPTATPTPIPTPRPSPTLAHGPLGFTATGSLSHTRAFGYTATLLLDGRVLIAGGFDMSSSGSAALKSAEVYDPATGKFTPTGSMIFDRQGFSSTTLPDGSVLIAGGENGQYGPNRKPASTAELYDPGSGTFTPTGSTPADFYGLDATPLLDGRVLVLGFTNGADGSFSGASELYDAASGAFTATGSLPDPRVWYSVTRLRGGKVLVTGGQTASSNGSITAERSTDAFLYDPAEGNFTPTGSMTQARSQDAATLLSDGRVLIVGGTDQAKPVTSAEVYDPVTGTFGATGPTLQSVGSPGDFSSTLLLDGRVLITGGNASDAGGAAISAELYDPATGNFIATTPLLHDCRSHTATLLADGRVLIAGGISENFGLIWAELYQP